MDTLFTIIMPSYKTSEATMHRALKSVQNQTCNEYELIVIDDNQNDEYKRINKKLATEYNTTNIHFFFHETNRGANYARNLGIEKAKGKFITFLDADDEWFPTYLQTLKDKIVNGNVTFITSNYKIITPYGILLDSFSRHTPKEGMIYNDMLLNDEVGPTSAVCVKREEIIKAGLFDVELPARQDYDMWIRVSLNNPLTLVPTVQMYIYRDGHDSISRSYKRNIQGTNMVLKKLLTQPFSSKLKKRIIGAQKFYMGHCCIVGNKQYEAISFFWESLTIHFSIKALVYFTICLIPYSFHLLKKIRHLILIKQ